MERRPLHRPRRLRIRRPSGRFAVLAGAVAALSVLAWPASATSGATCDAATHTVTVASGQTATIVRSGNSVTVPGCGGTGSVLGPIGGGGVKVDGGGGAATIVIDLSGGHFPSSLRFDIGLGGGATSGGSGGATSPERNTLKIVGSSGPDDIVAGSRGIALNGDDVVDVGENCTPDCLLPPGVEDIEIDTGGGDDSVSTGGSPGTGAASEIAAVVDGGSGVNTLDFSLAAGPVTANLFQGTASGARNVVNFSRILGSPFNDDLVGDHDNYI